ncbi:uncharacterized protein N7483_000188 [Penicillium malachiteum]|uniref:uncharacterized protein n=1 Tax=Penicillium malachiteum TaxID=1324776 RepID=UPI002547982B|nr:uncharacterized protein N7483_000188 [Penicillium malachiteum]KAJ5735063.1 hypothetical protein N7483_000188 [Penicillium malachiteum]
MGWVSVGALVATIAYVLYRYPPHTWSLESPKSPIPPVSSDSKADTVAANKSEPTQKESPTTPPSEIQRKSSTTPNVSIPSSSLPVLPVPTLNLEQAPATKRVATEPPVQQSMNGSTQPVVSTGRNGAPERVSSQLPSLSAPSPQPTVTATASSLMPPPPPPYVPPSTNPPNPTEPLQEVLHHRGTLAPITPSALSLKKSSASKRVILEPGYSPLDWAALAAKPNNQLRGVGMPPGLLRVPPSLLKTQNGRKGNDAWTSYQGKVYNITPYLPYHPGGKGELLRGAGKDSGKLFQEIHPWVNWDGILGECLVGILVSENDVQAENTLDAMD